MALSQIVAVAIAAAGAMVALWLLIKSTRGQIRVLAIIGTVLVLLGVFSFRPAMDV